MKKITLLCTILIVAMVHSSCLSDIGGYEPPVQEGNSFLMKVHIPGNILNVRSTVASEPGESNINTLHLLFFEAAGNQQFIEAYDASPQAGEVLNMSPLNIKVEYGAGSKLNHTTDYKILVVTNIDAYVPDVNSWLASFDGFSYSAAQSKALDVTAVSRIDQSSLLMSVATEKRASEEIVETTLTRVVTRFDVTNNAAGYELISASVWNVPKSTSIWNSDFNDYSAHIEKFYRTPAGSFSGFKGSLYAFENKVTPTAQNDNKTTCLILEIRKVGETTTTFYRVNVNSNSIGQYLKRNHVYDITINRVLGPGAGKDEDAYRGGASLLDVSINNWNQDNLGLILFDGDNVMALPTNKITFTPDGATHTYQVFTSSPDSRLALGMSKVDLPEGITVLLVGNTLTVTAAPSEDMKNGYIELAFGNLRGIIEITQTGRFEEYLELSVSTNGIPMFPAAANMGMSGNIRVTSSGEWSAKIYNEGFTFQSGSNRTEIDGIDGGTFTVATASANTNADPRFAFIIVMLNNNPDISRVLVLSQSGLGEITLAPSQEAVHFDPDKNPTNNNSFTVDADGLPWTAQVTGAHAGHFAVIRTDDHNFTVVSTGINTSGNTYSATVRVSIVGQPTVAKTLNVSQKSHTLSLNPTSLPSIPTIGGTTQNVTVTSSAPWTATIVTNSGTSTDGRKLVQHEATLNVTENGFTVSFPKVYYPNRDIPISATVTVSIGALQRVLSITQTTLTQRNNPTFRISAFNDREWGSLDGGAGYNRALRAALGNVPGYELNRSRDMGTVTGSSTSMLYVTNYGIGSTPNWTTFTDWMRDNDRFAWIHACTNATAAIAGYNHSSSPLKVFGPFPNISGAGSSPNMTINTATAVRNTKIWQFIFGGAAIHSDGTILSAIATNTAINGGGSHTFMPLAGLPESAVPLLLRSSDTSSTMMVICPVNRLIYVGESDQFNGTLSANVSRFLDNLMFYAANAAKYGSHFQDLFIEEGIPGAQPAPWDTSYWGDNAGVPSK